jgi:hypothetical protein
MVNEIVERVYNEFGLAFYRSHVDYQWKCESCKESTKRTRFPFNFEKITIVEPNDFVHKSNCLWVQAETWLKEQGRQT